MGFKRQNYELKHLGITIPEAYAQITELTVDINGNAKGDISIQQSREDVQKKACIEQRKITCCIDKELPLHRQVYEYARANCGFADWEDDIITEETKDAD